MIHNGLNDAAMMKLMDLEKQIADLKEHAGKESTAVIRGLGDIGNFEEAKQWVKNKMHATSGPAVFDKDCYFKGGVFQGMMFIKFGTVTERNAAIERFKSQGFTVGTKSVYAKADLPVEVRSARAFLFGLKDMLEAWEVPKESSWVNVSSGVLEVAGSQVASASVKDDKFVLTWLDPAWKTWDALQQSAELKALVDKAQGALDRSKTTKTNTTGKSKGKGKPAASGPH